MQLFDIVSLGRLVLSRPDVDTLSSRQLGTNVLLSLAKLHAGVQPQHLVLAMLNVSDGAPVSLKLHYRQETVDIIVRPTSSDTSLARPLSFFLAASASGGSVVRSRRRSASGILASWALARACFVGSLDCRAVGAALRPVVEGAGCSMPFDTLFPLLVFLAAVLADPNGYGSHQWSIENMYDGTGERGSALLSVSRTARH